MKKLVFGFIATIVISSLSYAQEKEEKVYSNCSLRTGDMIGKVDKESFIITADMEKLLSDFSIIAKESGLDLKFNRVEILKANPGEERNYYGLYAFSEDGSTITAISLDFDKETFTISLRGGTISCTSTGCTGFGCTAYDNGQYWTCSTCTKPCTKVTVVVIKATVSAE